MLLFLLLRGPAMFRQLPTQDEYFFSVAGLTVLEDGVPRIPYMPVRDTESGFDRADEILLLLPPLFFYLEAGVYKVFEASTGFARLTSTLSGFAACWFLYLIGRRWWQNETAALVGAGLFLFSRLVYFPAMTARPDMLFGCWGLAALWSMDRWFEHQQKKQLIASGAFVGLGFLTHPAALIYALLLGFWTLLVGRSVRERIKHAALLTIVTVLVSSFWLLLIVRAPDVFTTQFGNNVLHRTGPGFLSRVVMPWESLKFQSLLYLEHAGIWQTVLTFGSLFAATWLAIRRADHRLLKPVLLTWSGVYLHVICQGIHPTKGYWCYTAAPMFLMAGYLIVSLGKRIATRGYFRRSIVPLLTASVAACLIPGGGFRTFIVHLKEWNNVNYNAPRFTAVLLEQLPQTGRYVVDPAYSFAFYRSGRDTLLAIRNPFYIDVSDYDYDYLIAGPYSIRDAIPQALEANYERTIGNPDDPFACFAKVYSAPAHRQPTEIANPAKVQSSEDP